MDNIFQLSAILMQSTERAYIIYEMPWLIGAVVPILLDPFVSFRPTIGGIEAEHESLRRSITTHEPCTELPFSLDACTSSPFRVRPLRSSQQRRSKVAPKMSLILGSLSNTTFPDTMGTPRAGFARGSTTWKDVSLLGTLVTTTLILHLQIRCEKMLRTLCRGVKPIS